MNLGGRPRKIVVKKVVPDTCTNKIRNESMCDGEDCSRCGWNSEFRKEIKAGGLKEIKPGIFGYRTPKEDCGRALV